MDETGDNMSILDVEVIIGPINVSGDDGGEVHPILLIIATVQHVNHTLGIGIACREDRWWWSKLQLLLMAI